MVLNENLVIMMSLEVIPIKINFEIEKGQDLSKLIFSKKPKIEINEGDVIVFSQKIISKQEGMTVNLSSVIPSLLSIGLGREYDKDPKLVEVILSEASRIIRMENGVLIVQTKHGFICANAGVDESNVPQGFVTLLPKDPNNSALLLRKKIFEKTGKNIAVVISDTFGRPFRLGQTDVGIGFSGIEPILNYAGKPDAFGKMLRVTAIAILDELCSAAELVMGKTTKCPIAIIRNYNFKPSPGSDEILRDEKTDLFR